MTAERYYQLERAGKGLTFDEMFEGWHFCPDWDNMLVGPDMPAMDGCCCEPRTGD